MIALIFQLYDNNNKCVISEWRLDGGDFMLQKGFEEFEFNENIILKKRN